MVKQRTFLLAVQLALICLALASWLLHFMFYESVVIKGAVAFSQENPVQVNDHGSIVYITLFQSHILTAMTLTAISSFVLGALVDLYRRKRCPDPKER